MSIVLTTSTKDRLLRYITNRVALLVLQRARAAVKSNTLKAALRIRQSSDPLAASAFVGVPHYWAVYYHDGRGSVRAKGLYLVWFRDKASDPRLAGGYPVKRSQIRHLTPDQFQEGLEKNREAKAAGEPAVMIYVPSVGPADGRPFLRDGLVGVVDDAHNISKAAFAEYVLSVIPKEKATATIRLG